MTGVHLHAWHLKFFDVWEFGLHKLWLIISTLCIVKL
jgi:hypothetical protein